MSRRDGALIIVGAFFILWGIVAWLNVLGVTDLDFCGMAWGLGLIAAGGYLLWRALRGRSADGGVLRRDRYFGDLKLGGAGWEVRELDAQLGMGDLQLDLVGARVPPGETTLRLSAWVGDIKVWVPEDLTVRVEGSLWLGEMNLLGNQRNGFFLRAAASSPGYDQAEARVCIVADQLLGEISVSRAS
jgi:predicted membrane protein